MPQQGNGIPNGTLAFCLFCELFLLQRFLILLFGKSPLAFVAIIICTDLRERASGNGVILVFRDVHPAAGRCFCGRLTIPDCETHGHCRAGAAVSCLPHWFCTFLRFLCSIIPWDGSSRAYSHNGQRASAAYGHVDLPLLYLSLWSDTLKSLLASRPFGRVKQNNS